MEMFQPTTVENYPDGKGPLRGAVFQERFRGVHVLQRDEDGWRSAWPASCARRPARRTAFTSKRRRTRLRTASPAPSVTPRFTTSITTAASSAAIVWRPARPTRSRMATALNWPATMRPAWFTARSKCWPPGQHIWERTVIFNQAEVNGGRAGRNGAGELSSKQLLNSPHAGPGDRRSCMRTVVGRSLSSGDARSRFSND
jgi:hypothetical protein